MQKQVPMETMEYICSYPFDCRSSGELFLQWVLLNWTERRQSGNHLHNHWQLESGRAVQQDLKTAKK
jgi:hypothetical protein